jgi:hypothetical protein
MILYEVLRLYPPAVVLNRRTFKEMQLGAVKYPEGVILSIIFNDTINIYLGQGSNSYDGLQG